MHIAILETGRINEAIADQFDRYPQMFRTMFERAGAADFELSTVAVVDGELPAHVDDFDGYLVTGSAAGGYRLTSLQVIDQFRFSSHVEIVAGLERG